MDQGRDLAESAAIPPGHRNRTLPERPLLQGAREALALRTTAGVRVSRRLFLGGQGLGCETPGGSEARGHCDVA